MPGVVVGHNGKIMISSSNLSGLGLLFAVTLMSFPRESMCTSFDLGDSAYDCSSTLTCLGDAHQYQNNSNGSVNGNSDGSFARKLSLISEDNDPWYRAGIAYYREPIRMLDRSRNLAASFNTTFAFAEIVGYWNQTTGDYIPGDGFAFVVSADNTSLGYTGGSLGFFSSYGDNGFKSVVVEFDNFWNVWDTSSSINDIGWNHVAIDIGSGVSVTSQTATNVNIQLWQLSTMYAWIEYSADTQELELRISNTTSRPSNPLLFYKLNLSEVVEEYMYVGFSGSTGQYFSYYYIWNWTFESSFTTPPTLSQSSHSKKKSLLIGLSLGLPCLAVVLGGCCLLVLARNRLRRLLQQLGRSPIGDDLTQKLACMAQGYRFSYKQLSVATGGFPETAKLGQGGFGSVYRGVLAASGTQVAVKRLSGESRQGRREFMVELSTISQLRHRNLIQLLGWCEDRGKYMIVYELMPHGSLDKVLFYPRSTPLSWSQRYKILCGTAAAVDYLHQGWKLQVIHRDIKASNIMLDDDWNAKLGDFGLARLVDHLRTPATTGVAGTCGYIAPEAAASGKFTEKTDTFAFGTVALEIATGRRSTELGVAEDEIVLVDWVWQRLSDDNLLSVADRGLGVDYDTHSMEIVLRMGLLCCHPNPAARPPMRHVVQVLAGDVPVPSVPSSKPAPVFLRTNSQTPHSTLLSTSPRAHSTARSTSDLSRVSNAADSSAENISGPLASLRSGNQ